MSLEEELKLLLKDRSKSRKLWAHCPADAQIAGYVDGTADQATRRHLEKHFSDCASCLDEVSFLVRANEWSAAETTPPWLIRKAERIVAPQPKTSFDWRWATAAIAVSFAVIFAILFAVRFRTPNSTPDRAGAPPPQSNSNLVTNWTPSPEQRNPNVIAQSSRASRAPEHKHESAPVTRNSEAASGMPNLILPHDASVLKRGALVFSWQKVPDVAFYDVSIITASGDIVISRQSETESLNLPGNLPLEMGAKYFVSVRAHLRDGRTVRSSVASFRVID